MCKQSIGFIYVFAVTDIPSECELLVRACRECDLTGAIEKLVSLKVVVLVMVAGVEATP